MVEFPQYCSGFGGKGKGMHEKTHFLSPLPFHLSPRRFQVYGANTEQYWEFSSLPYLPHLCNFPNIVSLKLPQLDLELLSR
jgi:hypothetical protein